MLGKQNLIAMGLSQLGSTQKLNKCLYPWGLGSEVLVLRVTCGRWQRAPEDREAQGLLIREPAQIFVFWLVVSNMFPNCQPFGVMIHDDP